MKITQRIKGAFEVLTKGAKFYPLNSFTVNNPDYTFGTDGADFINKAYGQNPYVFIAINKIVERSINIDWEIVNENREVVEVLDAKFSTILNEPNPEGWSNSLYRMFSNYLANELFIVTQKALGFEQMTGFIIPNSQDVIINTDGFGRIIDYTVSYFGISKTVKPEDVLHIKRPNIKESIHNGLSILEPLRMPWESDNETWKSEAAIQKNKGINGIIGSKGQKTMLPKEQQALQKEYDKGSLGKNFGKVKVIEGEPVFVRMGVNPADLQSLETKADHLRAISSAYNVDPRLLGDPSASTYNNMKESKLGLITDAVLPMLNKVMGEFIPWVANNFKLDYQYKVIEDNIPELQVVKELQSARVGREVVQGIISAEQARSILYPEMAAEDEQNEFKEDDSIEGDNQAEEANRQAQANLRGSVGGVQGILAVQASVMNGTTSREAAIAIFMSIYGFTEEDANAFLN
jgi:HK97 family phage portal protein